MGSSSSDVFISCSSDSSSSNFAFRLHNALKENGIKSCIGDGRFLSDYDEVALSTLDAIQESRISILVISNTYAFHTRCLDELVNIIRCEDTVKQMVYPIFYGVDLSDVRDLTSSYGEAMTGHANTFGIDSTKVQEWSSALTRVANIKGLCYNPTSNEEEEYELIGRLVGTIVQYVAPYDVFLSFIDEDTGYAFTGNLYNALRQKKIKTFFINDNNQSWKKGLQIFPGIVKAIRDARISIVVLSKNYASSTWCLEELAYIIRCREMKNQRVWPIFYKVEPTDVRKQKSDYGDAMDEHKLRFQESKVEEWNQALSQVANLTGFTFQTGYEYELIQRIVESVVQSLTRYDVFLSFSGEDTRHTFSGYLYKVLCQNGLKIFMEDEGLEDGNRISPTLKEAIDNSRHFVIVFSENFAYSWWCLDELVKIHECMKRKRKNHVVWPIFYKVDPSDVRYQRKSYGDAITAHENRFGKGSYRVRKWQAALSEVPCLGGYYRICRPQEYAPPFRVMIRSYLQSRKLRLPRAHENPIPHENRFVKKVVRTTNRPESIYNNTKYAQWKAAFSEVPCVVTDGWGCRRCRGKRICRPKSNFRALSDNRPIPHENSFVKKSVVVGTTYKPEVIYNNTKHENELIKQIVEHVSFPYNQVLNPEELPSARGFTLGLHHPN